MKLILLYFSRAFEKLPRKFWLALFVTLLLTITNILIPYYMRKYLELFNTNSLYLIGGILLFIILLAFCIFLNIKRWEALDDFGGEYIEEMIVELEEHLDKVSLKDIDKLGTKNLNHVIYSDVLDIFRVIGNYLPQLIGAILITFFGLLLAGHYSLVMCLVLLSTFIIGMGISVLAEKKIRSLGHKTNLALKKVYAKTEEYCVSLPSIQTNMFNSYYEGQTREVVKNFISIAKQEDRVIYFWSGIVEKYIFLIQMLISGILSLAVFNNSIPDLVFFLTLSSLIMAQSQNAALLLQQLSKKIIAFQNVEELKTLPESNSKGKELNMITSLEFKKVSMAYQDHLVLDDLSFSLKKGETMLIQGKNGSGKSTIIKLMLGLYPVQKGSILINNEDLKNYSRNSLRRQILWAAQDETFPNDTVENYLRLLEPEASKDELRELVNTYSLPPLDTIITDQGENLSAGQKKKLQVAKIFLKQNESSVIVCDEIEAGLDNEAKKKVKILLEQIKEQGKIVIIISHTNFMASTNNINLVL